MHKYNLLSVYTVICMCGFRTDHYNIASLCAFSREDYLPILSIP